LANKDGLLRDETMVLTHADPCRTSDVAGVLTAAAFPALMMLSSSCASPEQEPTPPVTAAQRATVVDSLTAALIETYVFLETAEEMRNVLHAKLGDGEYDDLSSSGAFARRLEKDLQAVSHDLHLRVRVPRPVPADGEEPCGRSENYCFQKVEILPENIGYLKFNNFVDIDVAGPTAVAAMNFLLKAKERATIVGETTRGGAHPVTNRTYQLEGFSIDVSIPFGRAVNPITGTNWEGTGVEPDIRVSAGDALHRAIQEASGTVGRGGR
jgi:hypothetical protein